MSRKDKIQHLLISHLLEEGTIQLTLPDGMVVELGILKEDKYGDLVKTANYSWIIATQKNVKCQWIHIIWACGITVIAVRSFSKINQSPITAIWLDHSQ